MSTPTGKAAGKAAGKKPSTPRKKGSGTGGGKGGGTVVGGRGVKKTAPAKKPARRKAGKKKGSEAASPLWKWSWRFATLALLVGIGLISGIVAFRLLSYGREVIVPRVIQMRLSETVALLRQEGLRYEVTTRRHDEVVPAGIVLEQDVSPGAVVKEKTTIGLLVSLGSAYRETPDFLERSLEESRLLAQREGIAISRVSATRHDQVSEGTIIAQNPEAGTTGRPDVALLVSRGPFDELVQVPDVIGRRAAVAEASISERGLRYRARGRGGVIMWQRPEAGIPVPPGSDVEVGLDAGLLPETGRYPWERSADHE